MDDYPIGSVFGFLDGKAPPGWIKSDGARVDRKVDPELYRVLKVAGWHKKWRRWIVFLPNLTVEHTELPGPPQVNFTFYIKRN